MASRGKKKTTMAKFARETRLREKRLEKAATKELRRQAARQAATGRPAGEMPEGLGTV